MKRLLSIVVLWAMLAVPVPVLASEQSGESAADKPDEPAKPAKPKPKRPDNDKNCNWDTDVDLEIEGKHLTLHQIMLRNLMSGAAADDSGYDIYADPQKLILKIRNPDGNWYVADLTRLGDPREGCTFYYVGEPQHVDEEPPLF